MVNVDNINKMIEAIRNEPRPIYMGNFVIENSPNACGTTACLAGWANILRLNFKNKGFEDDLGNTDDATKWMGIDDEQADEAFFDNSADALSDEKRKEAALKYLTLIRDHANERIVLWNEALPSAIQND